MVYCARGNNKSKNYQSKYLFHYDGFIVFYLTRLFLLYKCSIFCLYGECADIVSLTSELSDSLVLIIDDGNTVPRVPVPTSKGKAPGGTVEAVYAEPGHDVHGCDLL